MCTNSAISVPPPNATRSPRHRLTAADPVCSLGAYWDHAGECDGQTLESKVAEAPRPAQLSRARGKAKRSLLGTNRQAHGCLVLLPCTLLIHRLWLSHGEHGRTVHAIHVHAPCGAAPPQLVRRPPHLPPTKSVCFVSPLPCKRQPRTLFPSLCEVKKWPAQTARLAYKYKYVSATDSPMDCWIDLHLSRSVPSVSCLCKGASLPAFGRARGSLFFVAAKEGEARGPRLARRTSIHPSAWKGGRGRRLPQQRKEWGGHQLRVDVTGQWADRLQVGRASQLCQRALGAWRPNPPSLL